MVDARYTPPGTPLHEVGITAVYSAPPAVLTRLRIALAGVILYAGYEVVRAFMDPHAQKVIVLMLISPVLTLALAAGMGLKSRVCALLLLVYVTLPRAMIFLRMGNSVWTAAWLLMVCACCLGVYATFEYHLLRRRAEATR